MKTLILTLTTFLSISLYATLTPITNFGTNPGNLNGYYYIPTNLTAASPLVIVCHGCDQDAQEIADRTEWNKLADAYGFKLLYPEQKVFNNGTKCFNWFNSFDNERDQGELASINQMVDYMVANHNIDGNRIYITGMSAGAAITVAFSASYPDVINRAAALAGGPYKSAASSVDALYAMNPGYDRTSTQWGDRIRNENPNYTGDYPKMAIFHGTTDAVVAYANAEELAEQWCNVNGTDINVDITNTNFQSNNIVTQQVYQMPNGSDTAVLRYNFQNIGHVIPIDEGTGTMQGGTPGSYTQDINFFSTYWVADFFNLIPSVSNQVETINELSFKIYNVAQNSLQIITNSKEELSYEIFDFSGRIVQSGVINNNSIITLNKHINIGILALKKENEVIYSKKIIFE